MAQSVYDRRGLNGFMILALVMIPVSLILMIAYDWKIGLASGLFWCVSFITLEAVSARPDNNPQAFMRWLRKLSSTHKRRPVLLCMGDSLFHGNASASITPEIPLKVTQRIGLPPADHGKTFTDPIWVVNAGQNFITSETVLQERLKYSLQVFPDYIVIMIGTNDVLAMAGEPFKTLIPFVNKLSKSPSLDSYEANLKAIIKVIQEQSPMTQVGLCTLPPIGEDLRSKWNEWIRQANDIVNKVAETSGDRVSSIPVYNQMESFLEKHRSGFNLPLMFSYVMALWMNPVFHLTPFGSWNLLSRPLGLQLLSDGIHLNERGRDIVADAIVDWLMTRNVTKAIAVKS